MSIPLTKTLVGKLAHSQRKSPVNEDLLSGAKVKQSGIKIRRALLKDVEGIMKVLKALSEEIPVKIDTEERRNALYKIVAECCRQKSWVALDKSGHLIGFLLGKSCSEGYTLPYGGVLNCYRKQGLFSKLLSKAKALNRPLEVDVSHDNKSGMAARLIKEGFVKAPISLYPSQDCFTWTQF